MKFKKAALFAGLSLFGAGAFAMPFTVADFAMNPNIIADSINDGLGDFTEQVALAVPLGAVEQNVWADAYIGNLFPSAIPHFGGGLNVGFTKIDTSGLAKTCDVLGISGMGDNVYYPMFAADVRVGGFVLPFDFGFTFMKSGTFSIDVQDVGLDFDFMTAGFDVRYALIEGGLIMPKLSVGAGYFYNSGSFGIDSVEGAVAIDYTVHTMFLEAQVSKSFLICTPFVGVRGIVSKYESNYDWKYKGAYADQVRVVASAAGATVETQGKGSYKSDTFDFGAIQPQVYAGVGVNFLVLQATLSVSADMRNIWDKGLWSGAFSLRAKL